jgi:hypothetical protein
VKRGGRGLGKNVKYESEVRESGSDVVSGVE